MTKIPGFILRDVLGHDATRRVLLSLHEAGRPVAYTELRERLDEHPETFHRSVTRLEHHGITGRRAVGRQERTASDHSYRILLETTGLGEYCAELWHDMNRRAVVLARKHQIPANAWAPS